MERKFQQRLISLGMVSLFFLSGCAAMAVKLMTAEKTVTIPQIVAHIEPVLRGNKIILSGEVVVQNPTESDLGLEEMLLAIKDENSNVIAEVVLQWSKVSLESGAILEAPLEISLDLQTLNKKLISVELQTVFIYKKFAIAIPIKSKIAVLHLDFLKESIVRPLEVAIYTRLRSNMFKASIDYALDIANPVGIDLLLENGQILLYGENKEIARAEFADTLLRAGQPGHIEGVIKIKDFFNKILRREFIKEYPLRFKVSGDLKVPNTDISMPFRFESIQSLDFSLFRE